MGHEFPKVLVVSHNVFGPNVSMGRTLSAYFDAWPPENLCQLYFRAEVPTTRLCEQYFRITDFDLLHALFRPNKRGTVFTGENIETHLSESRVDKGAMTALYQTGSTHKPWTYFVRNSLWKLGLWKSKRLDQWVRECSPDLIFYASGDYAFSYEVALFLSKKYSLPLVISAVDDYYFQRPQQKGPLAWWNTRRFRKVMERVMLCAKGALYVHPVMERLYREKFPVRSAVLYKNAQICEEEEPENETLKIAYFGTLGLRRDDSLVEIGRTIRKLIPDGSVLLDVYSSEIRPEILSRMTEENGIRFHGQVSADDVIRIQAESNILVFAESTAPELQERLRCSLSTKIPEYLGSNRCMLAYGSAEAGSISYLQENHAACVAVRAEQLEECLHEILFSADARRKYAEGQMELALKNHTKERNHKVLKEMMQIATSGNRPNVSGTVQ